jgi:hypothetical protein
MPDDRFVIAMQGDLLLSAGPRERARHGIWLVVSRFAPRGGMVSISITGARGGTVPPACLAPRTTLVGRLLEGPSTHFELLDLPPEGMALAGSFRASMGAAWLMGEATELRLFAAGELESGIRWRLGAERRAWAGEQAKARMDQELTVGSRTPA